MEQYKYYISYVFFKGKNHGYGSVFTTIGHKLNSQETIEKWREYTAKEENQDDIVILNIVELED